MQYDVLIVGGGPGGIYSAYELLEKRPDLKIALFEAGHALARRHCPIDGVKVKSCVKCPTCAIMNGFGGAGAFSDGKYNITNQFGGTLHEYIGKKQALELMEYVDEINVANGGEGTHLYSTGATPIKKLCLENDLHLLDASVRHLGTDKNLVVLEHLYNRLKDRMDIYFDTPVQSVERTDGGYRVVTMAPSDVQEAASMVYEAFDIADQYRNPVVILADGMIGQMMGAVDFDRMPPRRENLPAKDWALRGSDARGGKAQAILFPVGTAHYIEKNIAETELYPALIANETRVESIGVEDADIVLAAYGTASRMCRAAMETLKGELKLGLIRPKTLWPFPYEAFEAVNPKCKAIICPEINIMGQMIDDVRIAAAGRWPVSHVGDSRTDFLTPDAIVEKVRQVWKEVNA